MIKQLFCILMVTSVWGTSTLAQSAYVDLATNLVKEGILQGEAKLNQLPNMLKDGLEIAKTDREFESNEFCLGNVQAIVNMGAIVTNMMPFTKVWTYEDARGPVGKLRIMLNGQKIHAEIYCDGKTLKSTYLPWGKGEPKPQEVNMASLNALIGLGLNFQLQGVFDQAEKEQVIQSPEQNLGEEPSISNSTEEFVVSALTDEETTNLVVAIQKCWNQPIGLQNGDDLVVVIAVDLTSDGRLASNPKLIDPAGIPTGTTKQAFEAGRRALIRCAPYDLPAEKYKTWQEIQIQFNPSSKLLLLRQ